MNVALVQLGRIGDMILVTSAIQPIRERYPDANIYFIAGHSNCNIVENNPDVRRVLVYDKQPLKLIRFLIQLRSLQLDYYIDPKDHFSHESYMLARVANATVKIGFNDATHHAFDVSVPSDAENFALHFVEKVANALHPLGIYKAGRPQIVLDADAVVAVNSFLAKYIVGDKYILINISASNRTKMWSNAKWIGLIHSLQPLVSKPIVLSSAPDDASDASAICTATSIYHFPPSKLSLINVLVSRADLLISTDTSLVHIAAAFDTPVVALTKNIPWSIARFKPLSSKSQMVIPSIEDGVIEELSVEEVLECVKALL
ncbi:MAG: glycosyltransferase family 9 protein [Ignavibacteria bacterium]|jgi:ADP-heptose:LPS heptosyltransferase|nr:glycosyltransferase family 9 protein [Ignavibacteria bacterium]